VGSGNITLGLKCSGHGTGHGPSYSIEAKNDWSCKSVPHVSLRDVYREKLTIYILSRLE
jgi:hypothetical protein